jgi:hypothetical protein
MKTTISRIHSADLVSRYYGEKFYVLEQVSTDNGLAGVLDFTTNEEGVSVGIIVSVADCGIFNVITVFVFLSNELVCKFWDINHSEKSILVWELMSTHP